MSESDIQVSPQHIFNFSGDHLSLNFTNTLNDRLTERPIEYLNSYADLLAWSIQSQIISREQASQLQEKAQRHPEQAEWVMERAIEIRELIERIFLASAQGLVPVEEDLKLLGEEFAKALAKGRLIFSGKNCSWEWPNTGEELEVMLWFTVRAAVELLTSKELSKVRACAAEDCNWLFLDTSKNHSRRWCDMKSCGNRDKVRKFYQRGRKGEEHE